MKTKKDAIISGNSIEGTDITIIRSASETGQLYGSVSKRDIASSLNVLGHKVDHKQIILEKTIKELGLTNISLRLHPEVDINITLNIARSAEEAAKALGVEVGAIVKTLIFKLKSEVSDASIAALVSGDRKCRTNTLSRLSGIKGKCIRPDADEVKTITG